MKKQPKRRGPEFYRYLARLTAPIALQNLITFSLGLIDTFMVSQLGNLEMAAVTTANVPVFLLISIVFGIQSGVGILISQYWGKQDKESISRAIGVAAFIGTGISLLLALILFAWPVQIMDLLSNEHELSVLGAPYLRVIGFSYVFNMLSSIYVSAQRSVENAESSLAQANEAYSQAQASASLTVLPATSAAQAPVPHAMVSPLPRSHTRIRRVLWFSTSTNSVLVRLGKMAWCSKAGPHSSKFSRSTSGTKTTAWGFPMDTHVTAHSLPVTMMRRERKLSPAPSTGMRSGVRMGSPMSTLTETTVPPSTWSSRVFSPASVSMVSSVWSVSPLS